MKLKTIKYRNIWEEAGILYEGVYWDTLEEATSAAEKDLELDAHWGGELYLIRTEKVTMPLFGKHKIEVIDE
jgi:hypothetical protein